MVGNLLNRTDVFYVAIFADSSVEINADDKNFCFLMKERKSMLSNILVTKSSILCNIVMLFNLFVTYNIRHIFLI